MKKLNATNAIAILSLGLMFSVVVAGCGGNDTKELKVKNGTISSSSQCKYLSPTSARYKTLNCKNYSLEEQFSLQERADTADNYRGDNTTCKIEAVFRSLCFVQFLEVTEFRYTKGEKLPIEVMVFEMSPEHVDEYLAIDHEIQTRRGDTAGFRANTVFVERSRLDG